MHGKWRFLHTLKSVFIDVTPPPSVLYVENVTRMPVHNDFEFRALAESSTITHDLLNEFYKKGVKKKSSASTGRREDLCLEIQPTVCASRFARKVLLWLVGHSRGISSADDDNADRVLKLGNRVLVSLSVLNRSDGG
jgi:hypothetical protein